MGTITTINKQRGRLCVTHIDTWLVDCYEGTPEDVRKRDSNVLTLVAKDVNEDDAYVWIMGASLGEIDRDPLTDES